MNKGTRTAAEATRCPDLFRGVYWGAFNLANNADMITADILRNRDAFAVEWRLLRCIDGLLTRYPATGRGDDFDHAETYRAEDGAVVLVVSNYNGPPPDVLGLGRVAPIYGRGVESYAGRFASVKELRARLGACRADRMPFAPGLYPDGAAQGPGACGASGGNLGARRGGGGGAGKVLPEHQTMETATSAIPSKSIGFPSITRGNQP